MVFLSVKIFILSSFYFLSAFIFFIFFIVFLIMNHSTYFSSRGSKIFKFLSISISKFLTFNISSFFLMGLSLFFMLFFLNFFSLFSYIFSLTCLPGVIFILGLTLWFSFLVVNLHSNYFFVVSHLVPKGCPIYLISFMIMIETISLLIRPLTLSVRLMANISAGHLLIILVSKSGVGSLFLISLEILVSLVQAFVFSLLLTLYFNESN